MSAHEIFMNQNGLWSERLREVEEKGRGNASSIARLIYACEIGDGIDQHASEDLKAVSSQLAALRAEIADLRHQLAHYEVGAEMQIEEEKGVDHA